MLLRRPPEKIAKNSHQKSPKLPSGGILKTLLFESCRAFNSAWKNGIISQKRSTRSKVRPQKSLMKSGIFGYFDLFFELFPFYHKFPELFAMKVTKGTKYSNQKQIILIKIKSMFKNVVEKKNQRSTISRSSYVLLSQFNNN